MKLATRVPRAMLRRTIDGLSSEAVAESAVPSYCHVNPAIRWLFWKRLDIALALAALGPGDAVLDFGCGSGVLLPTLHRLAGRVTATDLDLAPARTIVAAYGLATDLLPGERFADWAQEQCGQFACILVLDVLEHVEDSELHGLSESFRALLAPGGRLVLSGPTESVMYRIGRFLAGFHGAYHHRSVFDIDRILRRAWRPEQTDVVPRPPMPRAFWITRYRPVPAGWPAGSRMRGSVSGR